MTTAAWWGNPAATQGKELLIRHAPDSDNYHFPDQRQLERIGMGITRGFAVVPSAKQDGSSRGFSIDDPGVVHCDPDAPDGGVVVDYGQVDGTTLSHALATSQYPHEVYYQLGTAPSRVKLGFEMAQPVRDNPHVPQGTYITPSASPGGGQMGQPLAPRSGMQPLTSIRPQTQPNMQMHPLPGPTAVPAQAPQAPQAQPPYNPQQAPPQYNPAMQQPPYNPQQAPPPYYPPMQPMPQQPGYGYMPPPQDPTMQAITQLTGVVEGLAARVAAMGAPAPVPQQRALGAPPRLNTTPVLPHTAHPLAAQHPMQVIPEATEEEESQQQAPQSQPSQRSMVRQPPRQQRLADLEEAPPANVLITGFETLEMAFLTGPKGEKATRRVVFEFPQTGKQSAVFHDVIASETAVVLVYDTRYEEGSQYVPPDLGETVLKLHEIIKGGKTITHTVQSMGIQFACGVLDFIVLIKAPEGVEQDADTP